MRAQAEPDSSGASEVAEMMADATGYPHTLHGVPGQVTTDKAIGWGRNWRGVLTFLNWEIPYGEKLILHPTPIVSAAER